MSKRSTRLALLFGAIMVVSACTTGASTSPSGEPSAAASAPASAAASPSAAASAGSSLKIGVQTDVGRIDDKNFNQYSYAGAVDGAAAIGAEPPPAFVPADASQYGIGLQNYVDKGYNIVVVNGFNAVPEVVKFAKANPTIWFVGVDHDPCLDAEGNSDSTFTCAGSANFATLLPNYIGLNYQEDQAGYLAGIVAAKASKTGTIAAVGGIRGCAPCVRYIQGFEMGAKSVNPDIKVISRWVTDSDIVKAFFDQPGGTTFAQQMLKQNKDIDVMFQVAGATGNGVIDAACAAGISAIGVDVDQYLSYPAGAPCLITSATKSLQHSIAESIKAIADGSAKGGKLIWDAKVDGVGVAPFHGADEKVGGAETQALVDKALADMKSGAIKTCPDDCGKTPGKDIG